MDVIVAGYRVVGLSGCRVIGGGHPVARSPGYGDTGRLGDPPQSDNPPTRQPLLPPQPLLEPLPPRRRLRRDGRRLLIDVLRTRLARGLRHLRLRLRVLEQARGDLALVAGDDAVRIAREIRVILADRFLVA